MNVQVCLSIARLQPMPKRSAHALLPCSGIVWQLMLSLYYRLPFAYHLPAHVEGEIRAAPGVPTMCACGYDVGAL